MIRFINNNYLAHHGTLGMKWGKRNGPPYPLDSSSLAKNISDKANKKEPRITKDVTNAIKKAGAKVYGIEHRLKTYESIKRKIDTDSMEKGETPFVAAKKLKDAVRYTSVSDDNNFTDNYFFVKNDLRSKGYIETRCKNYFDLYDKGKVKHKSVQSVFQDKDGYSFEIQFQTPSSQRAKDEKIPIYEERRRPGIEKTRAAELEAMMDNLAKSVSTPKNVNKIKTHN